MAVAVAYSLAQYVNVVHAGVRMQRTWGSASRIGATFVRLLLAGVAMTAVLVGGRLVLHREDAAGSLAQLAIVAVDRLVGIPVFLAVAVLLGTRRRRADLPRAPSQAPAGGPAPPGGSGPSRRPDGAVSSAADVRAVRYPGRARSGQRDARDDGSVRGTHLGPPASTPRPELDHTGREATRVPSHAVGRCQLDLVRGHERELDVRGTGEANDALDGPFGLEGQIVVADPEVPGRMRSATTPPTSPFQSVHSAALFTAP